MIYDLVLYRRILIVKYYTVYGTGIYGVPI
jgi:hypothetical protein